MDYPVRGAEPAPLGQTAEHAAERWSRRGPPRPAVESAAGGPDVAGHGLLAHQSDVAANHSAARRLECDNRPSHHHLGPLLALQPCKRFAKGTALIADGALIPTRERRNRSGAGCRPGRLGAHPRAYGEQGAGQARSRPALRPHAHRAAGGTPPSDSTPSARTTYPASTPSRPASTATATPPSPA